VNYLPGIFNYLVVVFLMMAGFYVVIAQGNLIKKLVGLGLFQASVFILYITMGNLSGGRAPVIVEGVTAYSSPLPHVLILTAIVVGVATTAVGLALAVRIHEAYDSVEEDQIHAEDIAADEALMDAETTGREEGRR
jgi:multicomponent Na+:H+ antiporter subunit C